MRGAREAYLQCLGLSQNQDIAGLKILQLQNILVFGQKDIQQMISAFQSGSQEAADAITKSQMKASEGNNRIETVGQTLSAVLMNIQAINDKNTQIASAAEQQAVVAEDINQKIISINTVAEDTSEAAQQNAENSEQLAELAEQMNATVAKFKLN